MYNGFMIYVSHLADERLKEYLRGRDRVTYIPETGLTDERVSSHADIYMCKLGGEIVFAAPGEIGRDYPADCAFNACQAGGYLIANRGCLNPRLREKALSLGLEIIHVEQGYARCNILPVDGKSVITSDRGIYRSVRDRLDVLLISAGDIKLRGFPRGFIGGTAGRIGRDIVFNGDPDAHPNGKNIRNFIESRGLGIVGFPYELEDIGSIIS